MKCILDLGLQKTGSKARQSFFLRELRRTTGLRTAFPESGRDGVWHRPLYEALAAGDRSCLQSLVHELAERKPTPDLVIISYEELYLLDESRIKWLSEAFADLLAVIFLRRQDQIVNSFHNQLHKSHRVPLQELETYEAGMLGYDARYNHESTLKRWSSILGPQAVRPVIYDKRKSSPCAFFRAAGIPLDLEGYVEHRPNRAMNSYGLSVLRWVKQLAPSVKDLPDIMTIAHHTLAPHFLPADDQGERYTLTLRQRQKIMDHYQHGNEWVRAAFFPSEASLFPPLERDDTVFTDYTQGRNEAESIIQAWRESMHQPQGSPMIR